MILANETFDQTWPFKPQYFDGAGFSMHYVDEGQGDPIICLHGAIFTEISSHLWQKATAS